MEVIMTALENIKNEFITNLLINQNKGVENIQKNLYSYEDYENLLQSAYEVIKNNPDDDITSIRKKMYETSGINEAVNHLIYEIADNSVDEHLAGYCDTIYVTLNNGNGAFPINFLWNKKLSRSY